MSYTKREMLEKLIEFKNEHGHYPARKDFDAKNGLPSRNTTYRKFGSIENAVKQAELFERGEQVIEDEQERKSIKPLSSARGFQCPFCGNYTTNADEYYSGLTTIIINRFIGLLNSNNEQSYSDGVMDCIYKAFGLKNLTVRNALKEAGYIEKFDQRFNIEEQDLDSQGYRKLRCYKCGQLKDDWDITVDTSTKTFVEYICEDCLSEKNKGGNKNETK